MMNCFDLTNGLNAVIGVTLILAGSQLLQHEENLGAFALALGYLIVSLAVVDRDISSMQTPLRIMNTRTMLAVGGALVLVAGKLLMYYHVMDLLKKYDSRIVEQLVKDMPIIYHVLNYVGGAALVASAAMKANGRINYVRGGLALLSVGMLFASHTKLINDLVKGDAKEAKMIYALSWGLAVVAVGYNC